MLKIFVELFNAEILAKMYDLSYKNLKIDHQNKAKTTFAVCFITEQQIMVQQNQIHF